MLPIARIGDTHICPKHGKNKIISGQMMGTMDGEERAIACVGDKTSCGASIIVGSSNSAINGKPVAYLGSKTSHGGTIVTGSPLHKVQP